MSKCDVSRHVLDQILAEHQNHLTPEAIRKLTGSKCKAKLSRAARCPQRGPNDVSWRLSIKCVMQKGRDPEAPGSFPEAFRKLCHWLDGSRAFRVGSGSFRKLSGRFPEGGSA